MLGPMGPQPVTAEDWVPVSAEKSNLEHVLNYSVGNS